ncbi:helicase-associated domain-containing protein [Lysinibacter cavernae]|uniref:Helicase XPB/Ssl2 N-terminal domain-containing protein n=1 Tax=Lysinibacter cavernae TaxID=1640652 RepID=A0A7X5TUN6_9MICO|nr:helicase-associated domain-containing protein [Lysinibacter cavernae]NIH53767.1 hypothetical protein [Lysinibacter cavernae]
MTSVLALSRQLSASSDESVEQLLQQRSVSAAGLKDFFDLAGHLLKAESLQQALTPLDRNSLAVLVVLGADEEPAWLTPDQIRGRLSHSTPHREFSSDWIDAILARLRGMALVRTEGDAVQGWPEVAVALGSWPAEGLPSPEELVDLTRPTLLDVVENDPGDETERASAERAFALVQMVGELIAELTLEPAPTRARGGLTLPASKRLSEALRVTLNRVPFLLTLTSRAGLTAELAVGWTATDQSAEWLMLPPAERWLALAHAWFEAASPDIVETLSEHSRRVWGDTIRVLVPWLFPAAPERATAWVGTLVDEAEFIGFQHADAGSSFAKALVVSGDAAAAEILAPLMPAEVDSVYVQPDLTVISPGPLKAAIDTELRQIATIENRALAATYRITSASLLRAFTAGMTEDKLRGFLAKISLTGIPQPLDYLVTETVRRYGSIRVEAIEPQTAGSPARTRVTADDRHTLETLLVDRGLQHLSLRRRSEDVLVSIMSANVVINSLHEAKYPAALISDGGSHDASPASAAPKANPTRQLLERLRNNQAAHDDETPETGFSRQLSLAIKSKSTIKVALVAPNGAAHEYTILPTSVSAARLRGLDSASDVERTLPLAWVTSVETLA